MFGERRPWIREPGRSRPIFSVLRISGFYILSRRLRWHAKDSFVDRSSTPLVRAFQNLPVVKDLLVSGGNMSETDAGSSELSDLRRENLRHVPDHLRGHHETGVGNGHERHPEDSRLVPPPHTHDVRI